MGRFHRDDDDDNGQERMEENLRELIRPNTYLPSSPSPMPAKTRSHTACVVSGACETHVSPQNVQIVRG